MLELSVLSSPRAIRALRNLLSFAKPLIVFLSKIKCRKNKMDSVRLSSGFDFGLFVERIGLYGVLGVFWNNNINVNLLGYSSGYIDIFVSSFNFSIFHFTGFYRNPKIELRRFS